MKQLSFATPTGRLTVTEDSGAIVGVRWGSGGTDETDLLTVARDQLRAYFAGDRLEFDLPLTVKGSDFQRRACDAMRAIPAGETRSYGALAAALGVTPQAVGQACGANPIPIVIPCHRVLGTNGLGGFSGGQGIETKVWLLRHERAGGLLI